MGAARACRSARGRDGRRARPDRARARRARLGAVRGRALARGRRAARRCVRERLDLERARRALRRESAHGPGLRRGRDCAARGVCEHAQGRDRAGAQGPVAVRHRLRSRGAANERALDRQGGTHRAAAVGLGRSECERVPHVRAQSTGRRAAQRGRSPHSRRDFSTAAQSPTADHACGRAVPLGVRVGRALADRSPSRSRRRRRRARRRRSVRAGWQSARDRVAARRGRALSRRRRRRCDLGRARERAVGEAVARSLANRRRLSQRDLRDQQRGRAARREHERVPVSRSRCAERRRLNCSERWPPPSASASGSEGPTPRRRAPLRAGNYSDRS